MDGLLELYQQLIIDHGRHPRNVGSLSVPPAVRVAGDNPLCGDRVTVYVRIDDGRIADARFEGEGCAISTAAASLMTEAVIGKSVREARALLGAYRRMLTAEDEVRTVEAASEEPELGKLEALRGVREYPSRVKCATLAWHALGEVLKQAGPAADEPSRETSGVVTTE